MPPRRIRNDRSGSESTKSSGKSKQNPEDPDIQHAQLYYLPISQSKKRSLMKKCVEFMRHAKQYNAELDSEGIVFSFSRAMT